MTARRVYTMTPERQGARRQRFFGRGELRLVLLEILSRGASHGYELIKEIESMTGGHYCPSPGVIYPTLELLQDQALIATGAEESGRKKLAITDAGRRVVEENRDPLRELAGRLQAKNVGHALRKDPEMKRALENLKAVLDLRINHRPMDDAQLKEIVTIIDSAAMAITRLA